MIYLIFLVVDNFFIISIVKSLSFVQRHETKQRYNPQVVSRLHQTVKEGPRTLEAIRKQVPKS